MKKIDKILYLEILIIIVSLFIYSIHSFINPTMNMFVSNLGVFWYVFFLLFLLAFGMIYSAVKKEPRVLFINITLFIIYLISPFIISNIFFNHG